MQFKSKSLNFTSHPWEVSFAAHFLLAAGALFVFLFHPVPTHKGLDIDVLESPKVAPLPIQVAQPKVQPRKLAQHQVFGVSRSSTTTLPGETVKTGNTLAKTPDTEKLNKDDPNHLPIPTEDYLITKMPELKAEARIPYPSEAKKREVQGAVSMDLLIDASGRVREALLVDGPDSDLNQAALSAVRDFQFSPALIEDRPVAVRIRYAYRFVLEH